MKFIIPLKHDFFFLILEMLDSQGTEKESTENSPMPSTFFPQVRASYVARVQTAR